MSHRNLPDLPSASNTPRTMSVLKESKSRSEIQSPRRDYSHHSHRSHHSHQSHMGSQVIYTKQYIFINTNVVCIFDDDVYIHCYSIFWCYSK